jgi:hypothetical protein
VRYLWLSGDVPYPSDSGRRSYSAGLSESLAMSGNDVIGLGMADPVDRPPDCRVDWRTVPATPDPTATRKLLSRWPAMAVHRRTPPYRRAVREMLETVDVDVVVVDHLQMAWALHELADTDLPPALPVVYVSHNHETSVRRQIAAHEPWRSVRKPLLAYDAARAALAERHLVRSAAMVSAITQSDAQTFREAGATDVVVVPPGYLGTRRDCRRIDATVPRAAVMVTHLDWHVKQANLRRLLTAADGRFARSGIDLRIVGPIPDSLREELAPGLQATELVGRVDSLDDELARARVGIVFE